jgi:hypothetical protein
MSCCGRYTCSSIQRFTSLTGVSSRVFGNTTCTNVLCLWMHMVVGRAAFQPTGSPHSAAQLQLDFAFYEDLHVALFQCSISREYESLAPRGLFFVGKPTRPCPCGCDTWLAQGFDNLKRVQGSAVFVVNHQSTLDAFIFHMFTVNFKVSMGACAPRARPQRQAGKPGLYCR